MTTSHLIQADRRFHYHLLSAENADVIKQSAGCNQVATGSLPNFPVLGALCQMQSIHSSPRRTLTAHAAVPDGWIDLTREGFCYAENFGILSFSVVAQSLTN